MACLDFRGTTRFPSGDEHCVLSSDQPQMHPCPWLGHVAKMDQRQSGDVYQISFIDYHKPLLISLPRLLGTFKVSPTKP